MMEETNFVLLWKEHYEKIDQTLTINKQLLRNMVNQKAETELQSLIKLKTTGIIAFVFYLLALGYILFYVCSHYSPAFNYFIVSFAAIFIINVKGFSDYIRHLFWAKNINYDGRITDIQQQLSKLQLSIINHSKIMCLQFPFWTTFYLSGNWFPQSMGWTYVLLQTMVTGSFVYLAYWLYKKHTMENLDKKWFRNMIAASGGKSVMKAMEFYKEIEEFKKEN